MSDIEKFLDSYKAFETVLRNTPGIAVDTKVIDYENFLDQETQEKLKLCRIVRNYIQHHEDGKKFAAVSTGMIKFLDAQTAILEAKSLHVKDKTKRVAPLDLSMSLKDAGAAFAASKLGWLPVVNNITEKQLIGIITAEDFIVMLNTSGKLSTKLKTLVTDKQLAKSLVEVTVVSPADRLEAVSTSEPKVIVIDPGKNTYRGILLR